MNPIGATVAYALVGIVFVSTMILFFAIAGHAWEEFCIWNNERRVRAANYRARKHLR